ncbi:MAG: hypothetical protein IKN30_05690, partial [Synergistaceae bacterium]|nr:hypothetical protein [Synergistaceae bacterium]
MYGNEKLPGVEVSEQYRVAEGSVWRGSYELTWFKVVKVSGEVKKGLIVKENGMTGVYSPIVADDIITATANLPGVRLGIVADKKAEGTALIGIQGQVDSNKLFIGDTAFSGLPDNQKI